MPYLIVIILITLIAIVGYILYRHLKKDAPIHMIIGGGATSGLSSVPSSDTPSGTSSGTPSGTSPRFPQTGILTNALLRKVPLKDFVWTEKTDGLRTELFIDGKTIKNTSGTLKHNVKETIFNTEFLNKKYYIFDSPKVDGKDISDKHFLERYDIIKKFVENDNANGLLQVKTYSPIGRPEELTEFTNNTVSPKTKNKVDGVILQRTDVPYYTISSFKYKRPVMNTVDFMLKYVPETNSFYLYLYGSFIKLLYNLQRIPKTNRYSKKHTGVDLKSKTYPKEFLILFSSPFFSNAHLFKPNEHWHRKGYKKDDITTINALMTKIIKKPTSYDDKILEMSWSEGGWVPYRERFDKEKPNFYGIGESNMELLFSPVDFSGNRYFESGIESTALVNTYHEVNKLIRKHMFKQLLTTYKTKSILDIAGGRGADSNYYIENGINAIFAIDADREALITYKNRVSKIKKKDLSFNAFGWKLDANNTPLIDEIMSRYEYSGKFKVAIMDYAIHYICDATEKLMELARTLRKLVQPDGAFMFTYFDGDEMLSRAVDGQIKLHSFTIRIDESKDTVVMPLPTIDRSGYREEPIVTKEKLSHLGFKVVEEYSPVQLWRTELEKLDPSSDVLDLSSFIKVVVMRVN